MCVCTEQTVGDELSPKCLELRVGRLIDFTDVRRITHTQTDRHTQTGTQRQTDRQTHPYGQTDRRLLDFTNVCRITHTQTNRQTHSGRQTDTHTHGHTKADRQTPIWADR